MLILWILGLVGVIWYAATRKPVRSRYELIALSILIYLIVGIVVYIALILIALGLSRSSANTSVLLPLIQILKFIALGGEIAISVFVIRWLARQKIMRNEMAGKRIPIIYRRIRNSLRIVAIPILAYCILFDPTGALIHRQTLTKKIFMNIDIKPEIAEKLAWLINPYTLLALALLVVSYFIKEKR